jgi:carboxypeptidase family protein
MKLLVLLSACAPLLAQSVQGTVVNRMTGTPLAGVAVTLEEAGKSPYKATTDPQGAYRIDGVAPGVYRLHFAKHGFDGPTPAQPVSRPFPVAAGSDPSIPRADMLPLGKISGRVLDGSGNPVKGAAVELLYAEGGQLGNSDGNGEFRFDQVRPGAYTLSARPPRDAKPPEPAAGQRLAWVRTWYSGAVQRSAASRIAVAPGAELWDQDIRLVAVPVHGIRGVVLDDKGNPAAGVNIELGDPIDFTRRDPPQARSGDDGAFDFGEIPDGDWRLTAAIERDGVKLKAYQRLQVSAHDIDRLELRLAQPFSIRGTLSLEAADGSPASGKPTIVSLVPGVGGSDFVTARPDAAGDFTADGVYPGLYAVHAVSPGPRFYLASIRLGDRESPDGRVELYSAALPLRVTYRSDGGTVRGTVEDCGNAAVMLMPQDPAWQRTEYIRRSTCESNGHYEISAVRPGEYLALAVDPSDPAVSFLATELTQAHINQASRVTVRANESTLVDLRVIPVR